MPTKAFIFSGVIAFLSHSFLTQTSSVVIIDIFFILAQWTFYVIKLWVHIVPKWGYERLTWDHPHIITYVKFFEKLFFHLDSDMHVLIFKQMID